MLYRKINRGAEFLGKHRFTFHKGWRSKPHPYWFYRKYPNGTVTLQIMRFEYWRFAR